MQEKKEGKIRYYILLHIVLVVFSATGIASKLAAGQSFLSAGFIFYYGLVIAGLGVYAIMWQQVIKNLPLITAYANKAVTVIWGIIFGRLFFDEALSLRKIIGAAIIVIGVYFIVTSDALEETKEQKDDLTDNSMQDFANKEEEV